jgi:hypothetical protein
MDLVRPAGFCPETLDAKTQIPVVPEVERSSGDTEIPACRGNFLGNLLIVLDPPKPGSGAGIRKKLFVHGFGMKLMPLSSYQNCIEGHGILDFLPLSTERGSGA